MVNKVLIDFKTYTNVKSTWCAILRCLIVFFLFPVFLTLILF